MCAGAGRRCLSDLETLLTCPPVADQTVLAHEDPFEGPFVAPMVFDDAEHLALPGAAADAATVCQVLLDASGALPDAAAQARDSMRWDAARLLWVSDMVVRRAGLHRWQAPRYDTDSGVHIPAERGLQRLQEAVNIEGADVRQFGGIEAFEDLMRPLGRMRPGVTATGWSTTEPCCIRCRSLRTHAV